MATRFELAYRAWPILVSHARRKRKTTYGELASSLGYTNARLARFALWPLQDYCLEKDLPPLTSLVINKNTRRPGVGFIAWGGDIAEAHERVFSFPWKRIPRPFPPGTLLTPKPYRRKRRPKAHSYDVPDREVVVNGRGPYQAQFRETLLTLYGTRCALCDTRHRKLLVAAHIIPWSRDSRYRLDPRNGILLCKAHDALFECGFLRISATYSVSAKASKGSLGTDAFALLARRTAQHLRLPPKGYAPNPEFLEWRAHSVQV